MVEFSFPHLIISLIALAIVLSVLWKKNKSFSFLFFLAIFWMYMIKVMSVVVFPFVIDLHNFDFRLGVNLVPFYFGNCFDYLAEVCFRTIFENVLLTIPFGFGVSFIAYIKSKNIFWLAFGVGLTFEITQLIISLVFRSAFRSVDINDVILNATGVVLGYGIFKLFGLLYSYLTDRFEIQHKYIFAYIYAVVFQNQ